MTELLVLNLAVTQALQAVSMDGSRVRTVVSDLDEGPDGIVVDQHNRHIYWTNMGAPDPGFPPGTEPNFFSRNGSIERVDFDGRHRRTIVPRGAFTTGKQLTADFSAGKLYWCDREGMQVLRCDLDGSRLETLVAAGIGDDDARDARNHCVGIAIDPVRRLIYWSQKGGPNSGQGRIFRAHIDIPHGRTPTERDDIELLWAGLPEPIDLDLDLDGGILVWTDRGAQPDGNTLNRARVQPQIEKPQICSRGYHEAIGLATLDGATYYVGDLSGSIRQVNLTDGTERELIRLAAGVTGLALAGL